MAIRSWSPARIQMPSAGRAHLFDFLTRLNPREHPKMPLFEVLATGAAAARSRIRKWSSIARTRARRRDSSPGPEAGNSLAHRRAAQGARRDHRRDELDQRRCANGSYTDDDLQIAEEIALRAAYAIDNARLYEAEKIRQSAAQRSAQRPAGLGLGRSRRTDRRSQLTSIKPRKACSDIRPNFAARNRMPRAELFLAKITIG